MKELFTPEVQDVILLIGIVALVVAVYFALWFKCINNAMPDPEDEERNIWK